MSQNFWSRILANVELDNRHSAQHSMSSSTIDIRLNIECLARQSTFSSTFEIAMSSKFWSRILANVELDNRHSAQHSMSSSTINIQLNIRVSNESELLKPNLGKWRARQSTFGSTFNVLLDNRHSAQHWMSSSTINIQLNIRVSNASKLLKPNIGECWARQSTFSSTFNV